MSMAASDNNQADPLVRLKGVVKQYKVGVGFMGAKRRTLKAVDGVDLCIFPGEVLGLVGESGCGKSTLGRIIIGLEPPTLGSVFFDGRDLAGLAKGELRGLRREMQIIFQDPATSLNPRMSVGAILAEPFIIHGVSRSRAREEASRLLGSVGLRTEHARRYPHQFSGGQRQRIGIARALALNPRLVVADEPVSALDVSIQAQILNLLMELKRGMGLTYLLVAHDLSVVMHLSTRIAVMYLGKLVEIAPSGGFTAPPMHPYTQALTAAAPKADPGRPCADPPVLGDVASPLDPPPGCRFHTRCPEKVEICSRTQPLLREIGPGHLCACHLR